MTYIIAEIGQNHNGNKEIAKTLIHIARDAGASAVKLTMRDLDYEMTTEMADRPYCTPNSYGPTYGEHRKYLELTKEDVSELVKYAKSIHIDVVITLCSHTLLDDTYVREQILEHVDFLKVASRDITNTLLIKRLANTPYPIILSSGLCTFAQLSIATRDLLSNRVYLMHCVSKYPTEPRDAQLYRITRLKKHFGSYCIGYSDHTLGIEAAMIAVALGAEMIEKHITLDRNMRGSDHKCSLEPAELRDLTDGIHEVNEMIGNRTDEALYILDEDVSKKLTRSVCSDTPLVKGAPLGYENLCLLSPGDGIPPYHLDSMIGRVMNIDLPAKTKLTWEMIADDRKK